MTPTSKTLPGRRLIPSLITSQAPSQSHKLQGAPVLMFTLLYLCLLVGALAAPLEQPGEGGEGVGRWHDRLGMDCKRPGTCGRGWQNLREGCKSCHEDNKVTVVCCGANITDVPSDLPLSMTHLSMVNTGIVVLKPQRTAKGPRSQFCTYSNLTLISLQRNALLESIEKAAFHFRCDSPHGLADLHIENSPNLATIETSAFGQFGNLRSLSLAKCGLTSIPDWGIFSPGPHRALSWLDLRENRVQKIPSYAFKYIDGEIGELYLNRNEIEGVEEHAFSNAKIHSIYLSDNPKLTILSDNAFTNTTLLRNLDLSRTKISNLPVSGLDRLRNLTLREVYTLKIFPPVLRFITVKNMHLTYPYHCCALKYPERQYAKLYRQVMEDIERACSTTTPVMSPITSAAEATTAPSFGSLGDSFHRLGDSNRRVPRWLRPALDMIRGHDPRKERLIINVHGQDEDDPYLSITRVHGTADNRRQYRSISDLGGWGPWGTPNQTSDQTTDQSQSQPAGGRWVTSTIDANEPIHRYMCGHINRFNRTCTPEPDALNPCEDVMGYMWLRIVVWFVVSTALIGNLIVLVVTTSCQCRMTVAKFLMCNLAFADLCLGAYLFLLAAYDLHTSGVYFAYAIAWQTEGGCQAAGFLSTFSICLSIFTLTIITLERWYAITHAINLSKRLRMRRARQVLICGWFYSLLMATLPLLGVSSYGMTSLCLPMDTTTTLAQAYVFILLVTNALAFLVILGCYIDIYRQVTNPVHSSVAGRNDAIIAKRMAILVFTDFVCLFPIAFFGITAAIGYPLITVTDSKILLVFFFPLNSCANPFLYAIITKQFRKDLHILAKKCSLCDLTGTRYRAVYTSTPISNSHSRTSQPMNVDASCWASVCPCCICYSGCTRDRPLDHANSTPRSNRRGVTVTGKARPNGAAIVNGNGPKLMHLRDTHDLTARKLSTVPEVNNASEIETPTIAIAKTLPNVNIEGATEEVAFHQLLQSLEDGTVSNAKGLTWGDKMAASTTETSLYSNSSTGENGTVINRASSPDEGRFEDWNGSCTNQSSPNQPPVTKQHGTLPHTNRPDTEELDDKTPNHNSDIQKMPDEKHAYNNLSIEEHSQGQTEETELLPTSDTQHRCCTEGIETVVQAVDTERVTHPQPHCTTPCSKCSVRLLKCPQEEEDGPDQDDNITAEELDTLVEQNESGESEGNSYQVTKF